MRKMSILLGVMLMPFMILVAQKENKQMKEQKLINEMQSILQEKMKKDYKQGDTKRDAHPKCLGLLKANFTVLDNIPEELKVGVFKEGKTYNSLIRISNASGSVQSDKKKDFRGFAIKLLGVEGERFTQDEKQTQDFLLMSHPTMPLGTVKLFRDAVYYSIKWHPLILVSKLVVTGKAGILKELKKGKKNHTSPLDITYWSTTPYQFGAEKVKYKIVPTSKTKSQLPNPLTDDYLTANMDKHLQNDVATFDFYIQKFESEEKTPIEDAGKEWKTQFIKVAQIEIPIQQIDTKERFELAEKLSFSPANSLEIHKPLGGINRARIQIYTMLSNFRHERDSVKLIEPMADEFETIK